MYGKDLEELAVKILFDLDIGTSPKKIALVKLHLVALHEKSFKEGLKV